MKGRGQPPRVLLGLLAAAVVIGGCGVRDSGLSENAPTFESLGSLPGLHATPDRQLQDELARVVDQEGTPEQLARTDLVPEKNVATGLVDLFSPGRLKAALKQSDAIFPTGSFGFNPIRLQKAIDLRRQYIEEIQQSRKALARPKCRFEIDHESGFRAELPFLDVVWVCARFEAFGVAESLERNDPDAAIEAFGNLLRWAECLAAEKNATCRIKGAMVRDEAMAVLEAIVEHPDISREHLGRLHALLDGQLTRWPKDADAWIGDRAMGMHAYEMVRAGWLLELLTPEEIEQFTEEGILKELPAAAQRTVNRDELYYLRSMREIIAACDRPHHARAKMFESIREALQEQRNSPEFPVVAARLLLVDIEQGHAIQAQDRATCEAWALALALACGQQRRPYSINPASGEPYKVQCDEKVILAWNVRPYDSPDNPTVLVPNLAETRSGR